ncbi:DUF2484 family protein [Amylibacter sp.]|jgi:hypothetical protein|nr:DUF2484 family protein [Amylibacter sp.]MDB9857058.1 DUF2484 family protein [Amylibacter sp.]
MIAFLDIGLFSAVAFAVAWIGFGTVIALSPKQFIPPGAFLLMLLLVPLVPYLWIAGNPFLCVMFLGGVASLLRWPIVYLGRFFRAKWRGEPFAGPKFDFYT